MQKKESKKDKEKRKRVMRLILAILIIHILLNLIKVPITQDQEIEIKLDLNSSYQEQRSYERQCFQKRHYWNFDWEGYNDVESRYISPIFRLFNQEDRKGKFHVQFGFFDQSIYNYNQYRDKPYDTVKEELPWHLASMHSENLSIVIGPNQNRVVTSVTEKLDTEHVYWVYALVTEPSYLKCETIELKKTDSTNATDFNQPTKKEITIYKSLWELFLDWIMGLFY